MDEEVVGRFGNQAEAEMWAEYLREQRIHSRVVRQGAEIAAVGLDAWVPHDVWVAAEAAPRARELLRSDENQ